MVDDVGEEWVDCGWWCVIIIIYYEEPATAGSAMTSS
jgi:hypothetical protein